MVSALSSSNSGTDMSSASSRSLTSSHGFHVGMNWPNWTSGCQAPPPTTPTTSLSSHAGAEDGLHMSDLDHSVSIGSVGMWVTPAEAEHARTLARLHAEQTAENKLLQARLYLSEDREAAAHSMSDKLAERVADLAELAAERGQVIARAWKLIKWLIAALVISFAFALAVAFK